MIGQVLTLLRVKTLKEEQALRALEQARAALVAAEAALAAATARVAASQAALPGLIDQVYAGILGRVVDQPALDDAKAAILALELAHQRLEREAEREAHRCRRCTTERDEALARQQQALRQRDKYITLTDTMKAEQAALGEMREEGEVEELSGTRRRKLA